MARLGAAWKWVGKRSRLLPAILLLIAVLIDLGTPRTVSAAALMRLRSCRPLHCCLCGAPFSPECLRFSSTG